MTDGHGRKRLVEALPLGTERAHEHIKNLPSYKAFAELFSKSDRLP